MNDKERCELERRMSQLDDHSLLRIVAIEAADYRPEAVEIASKELQKRKLSVLDRRDYLARFPAEQVGYDGFCGVCREQTTDESPGDTSTTNFILGTRLIGTGFRCSACGSIVQTKWLQIILPIFPLGDFRIKYLEKGVLSGRYIGRKLRK